MTRQAERALHKEVALRLTMAERAGRLHAVWYAIPNGMWIPTRNETERILAARLVSQLKSDGMLMPGVFDLGFAWPHGSGFIELKRPAERTLFGRVPKGRLSHDQNKFRDRCIAAGVHWAVCLAWSEVEATLMEWGILGDAEAPKVPDVPPVALGIRVTVCDAGHVVATLDDGVDHEIAAAHVEPEDVEEIVAELRRAAEYALARRRPLV